MADAMRTAEYSKEDGPYVLPVGFQRVTTAELTALTTTKKLNMGSIYLDTTLDRFRQAKTKDTIGGVILMEGMPANLPVDNITINNRADNSGAPGNTTINSMAGRAAFAAAASTVVITNSKVTANSEIFIQLRGARDATLTEARISAQGAGTFTVSGNAAATATTVFSFFVTN